MSRASSGTLEGAKSLSEVAMSTTVQGRPAPKGTGHGRAALAATTLAMGIMAGCGLDETASIKLTISAKGLGTDDAVNVTLTSVEDSSVSFTVALPSAYGNVFVVVANWTGSTPAEFAYFTATPQLTEGPYAVEVAVPQGMVLTTQVSIVKIARGENTLALSFMAESGGFTQADLDAAAAKAKADADKACANAVAGTHPAALTCAAVIAALQGDVIAAQTAQTAAEAARDAAQAEAARLQRELTAALARCEEAPTADCDAVIASLRAQLATAQAAQATAEAAKATAEAALATAQAEAARLQGELATAQAAQAQAEAARDAAQAEVTRLQAALEAALARCEQAPTEDCDSVITALYTQLAAAEAAQVAAEAAKAEAERQLDAAQVAAARLQRELEEKTQSWICVQAGPSTAPTAPEAGVTVTIPGFAAGNPRSWMNTEPCFNGAVFGPLAVGVRPTVVVERGGARNSVLAATLTAGANPLNIESFIP